MSSITQTANYKGGNIFAYAVLLGGLVMFVKGGIFPGTLIMLGALTYAPMFRRHVFRIHPIFSLIIVGAGVLSLPH